MLGNYRVAKHPVAFRVVLSSLELVLSASVQMSMHIDCLNMQKENIWQTRERKAKLKCQKSL
jgi:hypothetical protein